MQFLSILTMTDHENRSQAVKEWATQKNHTETDLYISVIADLE